MNRTEKFDFYDKTALKSYNLNKTMRYQLSILEGLDAFTRKHSENVANLTCRMCEYLKMDKGFTIYCTTCAYLHDIGKTFIPASVLQKEGPLTNEEYEVMKRHTTIGAKMCKEDLQLRPYYAGALYHHEALDGSGYPKGLIGDEIPYEAQIIRVADEFDAITSKRQYKTHIGTVETLKILIENSRPIGPLKKEIGTNRVYKEQAFEKREDPNSPFDKLKRTNARSKYGKLDKKILRALIKVILDDTETEISSRIDYVDFLKEEIKRIESANKYYKKMAISKLPSSKEYYRDLAQSYLRPTEQVDVLPQTLAELKEAYKRHQKTITELFKEASQIKRLSV